MSTYANVDFYINNVKVGRTVVINALKNLLEGWNMCDELSPTYNDKVEDAGVYWYETFLGYIKKDEWGKAKADSKGEIHLERTFYVSTIPFITNASIEDIKAEKFYKVYGWKKEAYNGNWYNTNSFYNARIQFENKLKEEKEKLGKLERIRYSVDYYNLNDEGLEKFNDDFEICKDIVEDLESKIYICQYMIDTIEFVSDMFGQNFDDDVKLFLYFA